MIKHYVYVLSVDDDIIQQIHVHSYCVMNGSEIKIAVLGYQIIIQIILNTIQYFALINWHLSQF